MLAEMDEVEQPRWLDKLRQELPDMVHDLPDGTVILAEPMVGGMFLALDMMGLENMQEMRDDWTEAWNGSICDPTGRDAGQYVAAGSMRSRAAERPERARENGAAVMEELNDCGTGVGNDDHCAVLLNMADRIHPADVARMTCFPGLPDADRAWDRWPRAGWAMPSPGVALEAKRSEPQRN